MQVERRNDVFRVRVRRHGAPDISKTFASEDAASAWGKRAEDAIRDGVLDLVLNGERTFSELLDLYAGAVTPRKRGAPQERRRLTALKRSKLAHYSVKNLRTSHVRDYRDRLKARGLSGSSVNRELALIGHILKWGKAERDFPTEPTLTVGLKMRENPARTRRLQAGEEARLLAVSPPWLRSYISLAIETCCRRSELAAAAWADIDFERRTLTLGKTKNGDVGVLVPLSTRAIAALQSLPRGIGKAKIFNWHVDSISDAFLTACRAAGISGLRLHDLRAEGVSRLFERGLDLSRVRAISRHKSAAILRYVRAGSVDDLVKALG